jgi:hypothetical protein
VGINRAQHGKNAMHRLFYMRAINCVDMVGRRTVGLFVLLAGR